MTRLALTITLLAAAPACVERSTELTQAEREQITQYVSTERPTPSHALDVSFEDKVELIGYDVEPATWTAGQELTVTWYWKCNRALEEGWMIFTHIADSTGNSRLNSDGESDVRRLYQPGRWKAGEFIRDVQRVTLPDDWNSERATFFLGIWNGPHRLQITRGTNDGENRARVLDVTVAARAGEPPHAEPAPPPAPRLPSIRAIRASSAIRIDGRLDDAAWATAGTTPRFVNTMDGSTAEPPTVAKILYDDEAMYVAFEVADTFLKSTFRTRDDHLWEQDCVEIMVDPGADGRNYFELQVSPQNVVFDTRYDTRRQPQPFGHVDWNSNLRSAVVRSGTSNDDEADQSYTVEIAIPWAAFAQGDPPAARPTNGDEWRINFYVMDTQADGSQRAAGFSPPRVGDFHVPDRFARVIFHDPNAAAPAPTAVPAAAPAGQVAPLKIPAPMIDEIRRQMDLRRTTGEGLGGQVRRINDIDRPVPGEPVPTAPTAMTGMNQ